MQTNRDHRIHAPSVILQHVYSLNTIHHKCRPMPGMFPKRMLIRRLCCKNLPFSARSVRWLVLFSLGSHSKQASDEPDLPQDVPFPDAAHRLCCKNSGRNAMGRGSPFWSCLGGHSKQVGDERDLPADVSF